MSTVSSGVATPGRPAKKTEAVRKDLHTHLRKTAQFIKILDTLVLLFAWIAAVLAIWLVASIVDHWLFPLPTLARWVIWIAAVAGTATWMVTRLLPLLMRRINPVYAARRIENLVPEFKNGLVSWLELESIPQNGVPRGVMAALTYRAARFIGGQDPSATVDTSQLIKLIGGVLLLTTSLVVYTMVSPKSTYETGKRIAMPWASVAAPTRVHILDVTPGDHELTQGKPLEVEVELRGLYFDEPVFVTFNTLDGQLSDQRIRLKAASEGLRYVGAIKTTPEGVEHELDYWVEAGDARSGPFRVTLSPLPTVALENITLEFPAYTKLESRVVPSGSEVEAVEGTRAFIHAVANQPISRGKLEVNPEVDAKGELIRAQAFLEMQANGRKLEGEVLLRLNANGDNPSNVDFRIRGYNDRGDANPRAIIHSMSVFADVAPEITLLGPDSRVIRVAPKSRVKLEVRANDPDFGLTNLTIEIRKNNLRLTQETLLLDAKGLGGRQVKSTHLDLAKLNAKIGDEFQIIATAIDNRHDPVSGELSPNRSEAEALLLQVVGPEDADPLDAKTGSPPKQNNGDEQTADPSSQPGNQQGTPPTTPQASNPNSQGSQSNNSGDTNSSAQDQSNDGSGNSDSKTSQSESPSASEQNGSQQSGNQSQAGEQSSGNQSQAGEQSSGEQSSGEQSSGEQSSGEQSSGEQSSGEQSSGEQASGQQSQSNQSSSNQSPGNQSSGNQSSGNQSSGNQSSGNQSSGNQSSGNQSSGNQSATGQGGNSDSQGSPGQSGQQAGSNSQPGSGQGGQQNALSQQDREAIERVQEYINSKQSSETDPGKQAESDSGSQQGNETKSGSQGSESKSGNQDSQSEAGKQDSGSESGSQGSESKSGSQGSQSESGSQGSQSEAGSQGSESKAGSQGSETKSGSQGSDSKAGSQGSQSESGSQGSESESGSQGSDSKSGSQGSQSESGSQGSQSKAGSQGSDSKAGSQGSESESGSQGSQSESGSQGSESKSGSQGSDSKSGSQGSESESGSQGSQSESGSQGSDSESGSQGSESESGSQGSESKSGKEGGGSESDSQSGNQSGEAASASQTGSQSSASSTASSNSPSNSPNKSGSTSSGGDPQSGAGGEGLAGDAADADYAEKTTELVLDYLNRQKDQPDPELLRELNWTENDFQNFLRRWNEARDLSTSENEQDRLQWQQKLQDLGLTSRDRKAMSGSGINDTFRQQQDGGTRIRPPQNLGKQFEAFQRALQKLEP